MRLFEQEFKTLQFVIRNSRTILLFAHTRPDPDTIGAVIALQEYLIQKGKQVAIACFDPFPLYLQGLLEADFEILLTKGSPESPVNYYENESHQPNAAD